MDILSSALYPPADRARLIRQVEAKYPSLVRDNQEIRAAVARGDVPAEIDVDAALMSSCRSDMFSCGRCAFWRAVRKATKEPN